MTETPTTWETKYIPQRYITLHYQDIEPYGPYLRFDGSSTDRPAKGTILDEGDVDIPEDLLYEIAARSVDDYLWGNPPPMISSKVEWALLQAGLAEKETRGGIHGNEALDDLLAVLMASTDE